MERRSPEQLFPIPAIMSTDRRPKGNRQTFELRRKHEDWRHRLPENTFIIYTEGTQSIDWHNGAGWYLQIKANGTWVMKCSNLCYLGLQTELIDTEAHVVGEALAWVLEQPAPPWRIIVCIDNSAVISLLQNNSSRSEFINTAHNYARDLDVRGVKVETRWTPAHISIDGNEESDQLAKTGSGWTTSPCPASRTPIPYLQRTNRQTLFTKWGAFINHPVNSWKYPDHLAQWDPKNSVTFFRFFCRRTNLDSYFGGPVSQCKCGSAEISSIHLLRDCVSLYGIRSLVFRTWGVLPEFGLMTVLEDSEVGAKVREFILKAELDKGYIGGWTGKVPSRFSAWSNIFQSLTPCIDACTFFVLLLVLYFHIYFLCCGVEWWPGLAGGRVKDG
jgi:hypothetical protein